MRGMLAHPLPLNEHESVKVTVESATSWTDKTAGLLKWNGAHELLRRIAEDDEFEILDVS
jgi:hypothetical protein